jgi:hypothetical protein
MFGRRRHAATVVVAPSPQLTEEQVFALVHEKIAEVIGENGDWTVVRRAKDDTDSIFHGVLAHSLATSVADALHEAKLKLESGEAPAQRGEHVAPKAEPFADQPAEPAALRWEPAPITVWTDLKKPVTGEIAQIEPARYVA